MPHLFSSLFLGLFHSLLSSLLATLGFAGGLAGTLGRAAALGRGRLLYKPATPLCQTSVIFYIENTSFT
jgi:hypothetical protein